MASSAAPVYVVVGNRLLDAAVMNEPDVIDFGLPGLQVTSAQFVGVRSVGSGIVVESPKPSSHHGVSDVLKGIIGARKATQEKDFNLSFGDEIIKSCPEHMQQNQSGKLAGDMKRSRRTVSPRNHDSKYRIFDHQIHEAGKDFGDPCSPSHQDMGLHTWELVWKVGKAGGPLRRLKFVTTKSGYQLIQNKVDDWATAAHTSMAMNQAATAALVACGGHLKENRTVQRDSHGDSFVPAKHSDGQVMDPMDLHIINSGIERESEAIALAEETYSQAQYVIDMKSIQLQGKIQPHCDTKSSILQDGYIMALAAVLPARFRCCNWTLLYSTSRDGISLNTLYRKVHMNGATILVVQDMDKKVFGCFASEEWRMTGRSYGNGECFVFQVVPDMKAYKWTRSNKMFMFSNLDMLSMGGGDHYSILLNSDLLSGYSGPCETFGSPSLASDHYSILLNSDLLSGYSGPCETFGSPSLASSEEFEVSSVEVWGFQ